MWWDWWWWWCPRVANCLAYSTRSAPSEQCQQLFLTWWQCSSSLSDDNCHAIVGTVSFRCVPSSCSSSSLCSSIFEHIWCQWCHHGPNCLWLLLILFICTLRKNAQIWLANWQGSAAAIVFTGCYSLSLHTFLCRPIPTSVYQQQQQQQYSSTCLFLSFDISAAAASLIAAAVIAQWTTVVQNSIRSNRQWQ